jgi:hypothetical protein
MASITYLRVDKSKQRSVRITVQGSGDTPSCFRGNAQTYRVAVFDPSGNVLDLSDHSSLNLAYMPSSRTGAAFASKTDAIVNATFTEAQWEAGTHYHAEFVFEEADMNPSLDGALTKSFWMVCFGILTATGEEDTHGGNTFTIEEDGTANTVTPPSAPAVGITSAQAAAQIDASAVRYDAAQPLDAGEKDQARQNLGLPKNKLDATAAPTTGDDSGDGYSVGSVWINVTADTVYQCADATVGAAVWKQLDGGGGGSGDVVGPASSVNNQVALFDGTTGKLLKSSGTTLGDAAAKNTGSTAGTLCAGDDSRLSNSRTPTTHASSHQSGGSDAIKLDDLATPDDNTDLNATTGRHGLLPKLGGGTSNFLRADGTWAAPPGASPVPSAVVTYSTSSPTLSSSDKGKIIHVDTSSNSVTVTLPTGTAGDYFWMVKKFSNNVATMARDSGVALFHQGNDADITMENFKTYFFWNEGSGTYRVFSMN